jgi:hypothetical protein
LAGCLLTGNDGGIAGGGTRASTLYNCTLANNSAANIGGGVYSSTVFNSILYSNAAAADANYSHSVVNFSCATPLASGPGNLTNDPAFVDIFASNFRLNSGSPCVDAGMNVAGLTNDLDGNLRPLDGNGDGSSLFDMGAYEFDLRTVVPSAWLTQYGLDAADPNVLSENPDGDTFTTFQEWTAGTDPTNRSSYFRVESISSSSPKAVRFQSATNRLYTLFSCANLPSGNSAEVWQPLGGQTDVPGIGGTQTLYDTNSGLQGFYKVGVRAP